MSTTKEFADLLLKRARPWTEVKKEIGPKPGLRIVRVSGEIVCAAVYNELVDDWLDQMFAQLPADACLMDLDGGVIRVAYAHSGAGYRDEYILFVASREWEPLPEFADIPELTLTFKKVGGWTCDNHAEPIHYTDGTETCYCGRGRN